jgi:cytochrome c oxidase subunit III
MEQNINFIEEAEEMQAMNPKKFALWLFIVSIIMLFAAFTSAYIVRRAKTDWLLFDMPELFWVNSVILIISSATMQWAVWNARKDNITLLKVALGITTILGLCFLIGQWQAWGELVRVGVFFAGSEANASGSFTYVLTGMHAFHILSGLGFLIGMLYYSFQFKVHSKNMTKLEICATYWHFLDILWLYLFVFLLMNR